MKNNKRDSVILFVLGFLILATGVYMFWNHRQFVDNNQHAQGKIIGIERNLNMLPDTITSFKQRIEFEDDSGESYDFLSASSSNDSNYHCIGELVDIYYDQDNPMDARVSSFGNRLGWPILCVFSGLLMILMPLMKNVKAE